MILTHADRHLTEALLDPRWRRRLLAEGDSWFSIGGITSNLLMCLDRADTLIVNCASPGDALADSRAIGGDTFAALLAPTDGIPEWDAVLLSAGGNDLIRRCGEFVRTRAESGGLIYTSRVDRDVLTEVLSDIESDLIRFLRICQAGQPGVPVVAHTYDYPPADRRWMPWSFGPWIAPVLREARVPREAWSDIVMEMMNALAERYHRVANEYPALHVVDSLGELLPTEWRNEIHPSPTGYAHLARLWQGELDRVMKEPAA